MRWRTRCGPSPPATPTCRPTSPARCWPSSPARSRPAAEAPASVLSQREAEVLQLFADGCSTIEVGQRLFISAKTVKNHLASIYEKLDARDRTQAVLTAVRMGIIRLN